MIAAAPPGAGRAIARWVPACDARTMQHVVVAAAPEETYRAVLDANLAGSPPARILMALARAPEWIRARVRREPPPPATGRESRLRDVLADDTPWTVLVDDPGSELVLGLLWSPPAGGTKRPPAEWQAFAEPGFAKVAWGFSLAPHAGGGTLLITETRTSANDPATRRRFRLMWPVIAPFAALLRRRVLVAIRVEAERRRA
jgi:hypothetical protein